MRSLLIAVLVMASATAQAQAQADSSLTREFGKLSAKERARIAKQEVEDAAKDERYQGVMAEAEGLFKDQRYDDALARFQEARRLRPLNVYPKVKIQDLQALIAKREESRTATAEERPSGLQERREPVDKEKAPDPVVLVEDQVRPAASAPERKRAVPPEVKPRPQPEMEEPMATEGMRERTFTEGRAIVLERELVRGGRMEVYRKVTHPWGQIVYFRDGATISERHWNEVFP